MSKVASIGDLDYKSKRNNMDLEHIPGNYGLPIFGCSFRAVSNFLDFLKTQYDNYGEISRTSLGGQRGVVALGPDMNKIILLDTERNFSSEMGYKDNMSPFFGGGLMLRDFDEHRMHRRIMQTAFKFETLKGYVDVINAKFSEHIDDWQGRESFLFYPNLKELLLEIAAHIFIGVRKPGHELRDMNRAFLNTIEGMSTPVPYPIPFGAYSRGLSGRRYLYRFFLGMLDDKRNSKENDMFSLFAQETDENGELFTDDDVVKHIIFLMMAAHDTTSSAISNSVAALVTYPEWQQRLREEVRAYDKAQLAYEDIEKLEQMDMFVHEVLRLHGPVPMSNRRTVRKVKLGHYNIPPHTLIYITPTFTHYMDAWWDKPFKFDPERFSPQRAEHKRHSFNFIPFGGGAHKCIGMHFAMMQIKLFLHQFLLRNEFSLPADYKMPIAFRDLPFPHPKDKLPLILKSIAA